MTTNPKKWKLAHIGIIVKDVEQAVEQYEKLGMGPFNPVRLGYPIKRVYLNTPISPKDFSFNIKIGKLGKTMVELIQPVAGESMQKKYLDSTGGGIHHFAYEVDDPESHIEEMIQMGYRLLQWSEYEGKECCLFFDKEKDGGPIIELVRKGSVITKSGL